MPEWDLRLMTEVKSEHYSRGEEGFSTGKIVTRQLEYLQLH